MLELRSLGKVELFKRGEPVLRERRKPLALLVYLCRHEGRTFERERLADLFWGDRDTELARKSLRQALSELRVHLGSSLLAEGTTVRLAAGAIQLDANLFELELNEQQLACALKRWRGDFLEGLEDTGGEGWRSWLEGERTRLRMQFQHASEQLVEDAISTGDSRLALSTSRRLIEQSPDDKAAKRLLKRALAMSQHTSDAQSDTGEHQFQSHTGTRPERLSPAEATQQLLEIVESARRASGMIAFVEGGSAQDRAELIRKSLLQLQARRNPVQVAGICSFDSERQLPFATIRSLIIKLADAPGLAAAPPQQLAELAKHVPELRERFRALPPHGHSDIATCVRRALSEVAAEQPLVVVLEDVPNADAESAHVISYLVRHPPPRTLLLLTGDAAAIANSPLHQDLAQGASHVRRMHLLVTSSGSSQDGAAPTADAHAAPVGAGRSAAASSGVASNWRKRFGIAVITLGLVVTTFLAREFINRRNAIVSTGTPLLIADIETIGADSSMARALHIAATVAMQQSRQVSVFPRNRVNETLALMGQRNQRTLPEPLALEVARRESIPRLLLLSLARLDSTYVITARVLDTKSADDVFTVSEQSHNLAGLLTALDRVLIQVRSGVGESAADLAKNAVPLPRVTTTSFAALQAYARGNVQWNDRDFQNAHDSWTRAVELDSTFSMAWLALADASYGQWNDRVSGDRYLDRAVRYSNELTERERIRVQLVVARLRGPATETIRLSRLLAERYPDRDTWYALGTTLMRNRRCTEAIPALQRALTFDKRMTNAWINIATCQQFKGNAREAVNAYSEASRIDSTALVSGNFNHEWGTALVRMGRYADAESAFVRMIARPEPMDRARGYRSLGYLQMIRGQYHGAIASFDSAVRLSTQAKTNLTQYRNLLLLAQALTTAGELPNAVATLGEARALASAAQLRVEPAFRYFGMLAYSRAGLLADAMRERDSLVAAMTAGREDDVAYRQVADAHLQLMRGNPRNSLAILDSVRDTTVLNFVLPLRGDALALLGDLVNSRASWEKLSRAVTFGTEIQDVGSRALMRVGELAEQSGDNAGAVKAYQAYLAQFADGDKNLPELVQARLRLSQLTRSRDRTKAETLPRRVAR